MNMLSIIMPANVKLFFSFIVDLVNFKLFNADPILEYIFGLKEEFNDSNVSPEFSQTGYASTNIIKNIGLLFLALVVFAILIAIVLLLRLLQEKYQL